MPSSECVVDRWEILWLICMYLRKGMGSSIRSCCVIHNKELTHNSFLISDQSPQGKIWVKNLASEKSHWSLFVPPKKSNRELPTVMGTSQSLLVYLAHQPHQGGPSVKLNFPPTSPKPRGDITQGFGEFLSFCSHVAWREPALSPMPSKWHFQHWRLRGLQSLENQEVDIYRDILSSGQPWVGLFFFSVFLQLLIWWVWGKEASKGSSLGGSAC